MMQLSQDVQRLLDRAERAITHSRELAAERRNLIAHYDGKTLEREIRLNVLPLQAAATP
jgi:hypothetical protein